MSRIVSTEELDLIEQIIAKYPEGVGISALEKALADLLPAINRRTLQRRLKKLRDDNRITTEGKSIALVYKPATIGISSDSVVIKVESDAYNRGRTAAVPLEAYIPVSKEGAIIRDLVRQPLTMRKPVGYQRSFLEEYQPGITFYLSKSLRSQLHEIGNMETGTRPAGTYAREILGRLLIDLSWSSSRLEGNTYSRLDTEKLIQFGQAAKGKNLQETQMILGHKAAIEMLVEEADQIGFNMFTFLNLHAILSENLLPDEDASGRLRRRPVDISGSVFHPPVMPQALEECFRMLLRKASAIDDPFEQSFFVMVQLPYLQPFEDVNKRTSRLGANIPLIQNNLCPLSFIDVPEQAYIDGTIGVYELNQIDLLRDVFVWAYERSCQRYLAITQTMAEPDPLRIKYREQIISGVQAIVRGNKEISAASVQHLADNLVPERDREAFCKIFMDILHRLHEGNVVRYRLKLSEFQEWRQNRKT